MELSRDCQQSTGAAIRPGRRNSMLKRATSAIIFLSLIRVFTCQMIKRAPTFYLCKAPFPQYWALKKGTYVKHSQIGYHGVVLVTSTCCTAFLHRSSPRILRLISQHSLLRISSYLSHQVDFCWSNVTGYPLPSSHMK
jgi:hypothetical protein